VPACKLARLALTTRARVPTGMHTVDRSTEAISSSMRTSSSSLRAGVGGPGQAQPWGHARTRQGCTGPREQARRFCATCHACKWCARACDACIGCARACLKSVTHACSTAAAAAAAGHRWPNGNDICSCGQEGRSSSADVGALHAAARAAPRDMQLHTRLHPGIRGCTQGYAAAPRDTRLHPGIRG